MAVDYISALDYLLPSAITADGENQAIIFRDH